MRRVIGDRDVLVAERMTLGDHRLDGIAAVAPQRVHVQVAADVLARDQRRQIPAGRERDFVLAVADLRRNDG